MTTGIVVGVDGSANSDAAVLWAADVAWSRRCPLKIVYVVDRPPLRVTVESPADPASQGRAIWAQVLAAGRHHNLAVHSATVKGQHPADTLIDESAHAAMVVVGSRRRGWLQDLFLRSTSLHTAMHARCPVAVVRAGRPAQAGGASAPVVVGVDSSAQSKTAAVLAFQEAHLRGVPLRMVHVEPAGDAPSSWARAARTGMFGESRSIFDECVEAGRQSHPDVKISTETIRGRPAAVLAHQSRSAALIVVGSHGRGGFTGMLQGSVSQALVRHAACPVLVSHRHDRTPA